MESGRKNGPGGGLSAKTVRYVHATLHKVLADAPPRGQARFPATGVDAVRHSTVGDLEDAGFLVRAAPTRAIPDHVLVGYEGQWDDEVAERFDACFGPLDEEE